MASRSPDTHKTQSSMQYDMYRRHSQLREPTHNFQFIVKIYTITATHRRLEQSD